MATHQTVSTEFVFVNGTKLAYRRFGKSHNIPTLFLTHYRGTMDLIDPLLTNCIAQTQEVILLDNAGCGHSEGKIEDTLQESGRTVVGFLTAIGVAKVNLLGFSLGGMIAQCIAVEHPQVIHKLILAGTQSSLTEGMIFGTPEISDIAGSRHLVEEDMLKLFFCTSETSKALGRAWWKRVAERSILGEEKKTFVDEDGARVQQAAISNFVSNPSFFARFTEVKIPVLVTNGKDDIMTPTRNSYIMQEYLQNSELHIFPDSAHAHLYQFPEKYAKYLNLFLQE